MFGTFSRLECLEHKKFFSSVFKEKLIFVLKDSLDFALDVLKINTSIEHVQLRYQTLLSLTQTVFCNMFWTQVCSIQKIFLYQLREFVLILGVVLLLYLRGRAYTYVEFFLQHSIEEFLTAVAGKFGILFLFFKIFEFFCFKVFGL